MSLARINPFVESLFALGEIVFAFGQILFALGETVFRLKEIVFGFCEVEFMFKKFVCSRDVTERRSQLIVECHLTLRRLKTTHR